MALGLKDEINWRNFWVCFFISFGQLAFGYPASVISVTLGQPSFLVYMKLVDENGLVAGAEGLIGAMNGVFQAGAVIGIFGLSWVMDKYGRKAGVYYCAGLSIFGGALLCASQNIGMFIAFRFFAGAGSWSFLAITPLYTAELAPPAYRGFFVGMNGMCITIGYFLAGSMGLAFFYTNTKDQWRGPLGLALFFPILMIIIVQFVPESPRWLLMKGRTDEAWNIISDLHKSAHDPDQVFSRGEFYQMMKQTELDMTLNPSWKQMFVKPSYRKRVIIGMGFAFIGQSTAVLVINNYGPTFYKSLGFATRDQLILQVGWLAVGIPFNLLGALFMDRVGRRPLMLFGVIGCCICLSIEAAMTALYVKAGTNKAGLGVGVAAFYLFLAVYSVGIDVCGVVFYGELFPNHIRAKGISLCIATIALTDLVFLQSASTAFANIGWYFFLVFIIITAIGFVWLFFVLPETRGLPLEEIAAIFGDEDEVMVYQKNLHFDANTHHFTIAGKEGSAELEKVITEYKHVETEKKTEV